jgi:hypothetical protein
MAFGLDSVIELASAGALIWRLTVELRRGQAFSENAERLASQIAGGLLFALAAYVTIAAFWSLTWGASGQGVRFIRARSNSEGSFGIRGPSPFA